MNPKEIYDLNELFEAVQMQGILEGKINQKAQF